MTTTTQLSPSQHALLAHAAHHTGGIVEWFPDNLKGGARKKVLDGLFNRALITRDGDGWCVAAEGYDALGCARPPLPAIPPCPTVEAAVEAVETTLAQDRADTKPRTRANSKQAQVIALLQRPEGATINQICETTGWQSHTVRGTFAGAFKKKLGLNITSSKADGSERIYRIC